MVFGVTLEMYFDYLTGFGMILWYIGFELKKRTRTNLLDSNWFYYNQAEMPLEKSEDLLELSAKQLVMELRLVSSISLGQAMFHVWKNKCLLQS